MTPEREERARKNREKFPTIARMTDALRVDFPNAKLLGAIEGGIELGAATDNLRAKYAEHMGAKK